MARRIRVALVGAGGMANRYHYPSLASFPDVELAAICDLIPDKARQTAEKFGIGRKPTRTTGRCWTRSTRKRSGC